MSDPTGAPKKSALLRRWRPAQPWLLGLAVLLVVLLAAWRPWHHRGGAARYVTAEVTRGTVIRGIITTGTVNPVVTVQVGSYVSGTIQALYCDYNTQVKAHQLCAKVDPRPYQMVVDQERANLESARAQLAKDQATLTYARVKFQRDSTLNLTGGVSDDDLNDDKSILDADTAQVSLDQASILQRTAALQAAQVNLQYTDIVSPVAGTVISRNVDVGQTVAASFQTPTLFLIAKDLTQMQVDASVGEADIGGVALGQRASFTVEAHPDNTFWGQVAQIRRAPITVQNVVTYDVVIAVQNPDLLLLPGMTANTRIVTAARDSVLRVPLQALRYSPQGVTGEAAGGGSSPSGRVWVLRQGRPEPVAIVTGVEDGTFAEVTSGALGPGDPVVVDEARAGAGRSRGGTSQPLRPFGR